MRPPSRYTLFLVTIALESDKGPGKFALEDQEPIVPSLLIGAVYTLETAIALES